MHKLKLMLVALAATAVFGAGLTGCSKSDDTSTPSTSSSAPKTPDEIKKDQSPANTPSGPATQPENKGG